MRSEIGDAADALPPGAPALALHIGVNSGHGIARVVGGTDRLDYGVLGDTVILAQRLEAAAPPGEIYVGPTTFDLTRRRFAYAPVGPLTVKGRERPLETRRLLGTVEQAPISVGGAAGRPSDHGAVEGGPTADAPSGLVGRDRELEGLESRLDDLAAGRGGVLAVVGEPGVGKSSLVAALRDAARDRAIGWLDTRCLSYGAALAYRPIAELVRNAAGIRLEDRPDVAAPALRSALGSVGAIGALPLFERLLGLSRTPAAEATDGEPTPEALQRALHDAVVGWLVALARPRPLVVRVEDVHWIDAASLGLLAEVASGAGPASLLLVLTGRPEAVDQVEAIAARTTPERIATVRLGPLDGDAVARLVRERLPGAEPSDELLELIADRTSGNPFFVEEVLRALVESDGLRLAGGRWHPASTEGATAIPASVEEVLAARLDRLSPRSASVVQTAAVIGRRIRPGLLRGVVPEPWLGDAVDELVALGFLDRGADEEVAFHHALVQDVAYGRMLRRRRRDLHRRVAAVAEALYGSGDDYIELLARHLYLGDAGAPALDALVRAATRAHGVHANDEAIIDLERAAEVAERAGSEEPSLAERLPMIRLDLADLCELTGRYERALELYRLVADRTGDARAWRGIAAVLRKQGAYAEALATTDVALAGLRAGGEDVRPLLEERAWTLIVAGRPNEAIDALGDTLEAVAEGAADEADGVGDALTARLLLQRARARTVLEDEAGALVDGERAEAILRALGDERGLATAVRIVGEALANAGRLDEAAARLRDGVALAERLGTVEELGGCLINLGLVELARGAIREAIECDRRAAELFERVGHASGRAVADGNLAEKLLAADDPPAALEAADRALALARAIGHEGTLADAGRTRALALERLGRTDEAAEAANAAAAAFDRVGAPDAAAEAREVAARTAGRSTAPSVEALTS